MNHSYYFLVNISEAYIRDLLKNTFEDTTLQLIETFDPRLQSFKELVQEQSSYVESTV